jgi:Sporulation and spore germination
MTETGLARSGLGSVRSARRRERLVARWRLSTLLVALVAIVAVGAVLTAAFSLGGFGVPTDSAPQQLSTGAVPYGLLNKTAPRPPVSDSNRKQHTEEVNVYFMGTNNRLKLVLVEIPLPVTLSSTLIALFNGPGSTQSGGPTGVQTAIPPGTQLLLASISSTVATVDLSPQIEDAVGEQVIQAFAQIVYTVTNSDKCPSKPLAPTTSTTEKGSGAPRCVDRVLFEIDGQPQQVPIAPSGAETSKPVTRADYRQLAPPS